MANHGADTDQPLTPLAQWMRETTGIQGHENDFREFIVTAPRPNVIRVVPTEDYPAPARQPSYEYRTLDEIIVPWEFDRNKLYQAAKESVSSYIDEGHTQEEILVHEQRIWELHDKLLGAENGKGND